MAELQHLAVTQGLKKPFKNMQSTVEQLSFVVGQKLVSPNTWHDLVSKFGVSKDDRPQDQEKPRPNPVG